MLYTLWSLFVDNDLRFAMLITLAALVTLVGLHGAWQSEWKGDWEYSLIVRVIAYLMAIPLILGWYSAACA